MQPYGYLSNYSNAVTPPLLDLILQNETGHLSQADRWNPYKSRSSKGAIGGYQFMPKDLHDLGFKLPAYNINDALDPIKSRDMAGKFIKGYSGHYGFKNLADTLIGYNWGARKTSDWIKRGRNFDELPDETKAYLKRAKTYIDQHPNKYNIAKINQKIAEVSNDNQEEEGTNSMYRPNLRMQRMAQNFIDGSGSRSLVPDPYSEGHYEDTTPVLLANNYKPNPHKQRIAQRFIEGRRWKGGDPYSEGHYDGVPIDRRLENLVGQDDLGEGYTIRPLEKFQDAYDYTNEGNYDGVPILSNDGYDYTNEGNYDGVPILSNDAYDYTNEGNYDGVPILSNDGYDYTNEGNYDGVPIQGSANAATNNKIRSRIESPTLMKRRDNQDLSKGVTRPSDQIDLNEMLIRIGGAGLANSHLGGNRQMADATAMYGNIMDYNRSQGLAKYKIDMANAKKSAKQARADSDYLGTIDRSLGDMDRALAGIRSGGVTGLFDGTLKAWWDSLVGNQAAKTRLLLQKLKVDDTLLRIAQTKGAISNKEMDLFMSPAPSVGLDQENIWADWINERKKALQDIKARLTGNMQVVPSQQASQSQLRFGVQVRKLTS